MRKILSILLLFVFQTSFAQGTTESFRAVFNRFSADADFRHAVIGFKVLDLNTGKVVLDHQSQTGLPAASTQKIITSATAYALLGKDFSYKTVVGYTGEIKDGELHGDIVIRGSGDPTLGGGRYAGTKEQNVINEIVAAIREAGIITLDGHVLIDESSFDGEIIPDGWIWQDIGNYYGAGAHALNWRENQFDLYLQSGSAIGSQVLITGTRPRFIPGLSLASTLKAGAAGSGDHAYIYFPDFGNTGYVRGTIPAGQQRFTITGSIPNPGRLLAVSVEAVLKKQHPEQIDRNYPANPSIDQQDIKEIYSLSSPHLDSINYWFLRKSINLYGEALLKTFGEKFGKSGSTEEGLAVVKKFWAEKGIDDYALGMTDGSGLSPVNRISADVLVKVLLFARKQPWFDSYFDGFPEIHGIKMKSGTIGGGVAYAGMISSKTKNCVFAIILNNYKGTAAGARTKIWRLLDHLK